MKQTFYVIVIFYVQHKKNSNNNNTQNQHKKQTKNKMNTWIKLHSQFLKRKAHFYFDPQNKIVVGKITKRYFFECARRLATFPSCLSKLRAMLFDSFFLLVGCWTAARLSPDATCIHTHTYTSSFQHSSCIYFLMCCCVRWYRKRRSISLAGQF